MLSISVIQYLCSYQHQLTKPIAAVELHQLQGENDAESNKLQRAAASQRGILWRERMRERGKRDKDREAVKAYAVSAEQRLNLTWLCLHL